MYIYIFNIFSDEMREIISGTIKWYGFIMPFNAADPVSVVNPNL